MLSTQELECLLSLTPSLGHLKLISSRSTLDSIFDGSYWEQLIQKKLLLLNQFQFSFTCIKNEFDDTATFDSLILPFQSPFWVNNKKWFVTCGYILQESIIMLYTRPLCIELDGTTRSSVSEVSSTNPKCRLILHDNYNRIYNIKEERKQSKPSTLLIRLKYRHSSVQALIKLNLEGNPGSYCTTVSTAIQLQNDKMITMMDLSGNHIGDTGIQYLATVLQNNTTIKQLNLSNNGISDTGVQYLADMLRSNTTITSINLSRNQIGDIGAKYLGDTLQNNKTLTTLILDSHFFGDYHNKTNTISDVGAQILADALKNNRTLVILSLKSHQIGDTGVQLLAVALENNEVTNVF
ncbi:unnamed protein product [Adineta steineri]|uniref:Uncharacterized protein n=1 Tax=Adineta steineri TaxID=433720 RepID=A0A815MH47_9BILA|nr:unnamed protein product [Adineta steineri]